MSNYDLFDAAKAAFQAAQAADAAVKAEIALTGENATAEVVAEADAAWATFRKLESELFGF